MKTIICPTDFSTCSSNAAVYAAQLAGEFNSRLILVHAYESPLIYSEAALVIPGDVLEITRQVAEKKMTSLKNKLLDGNAELSIKAIIKEGIAGRETCLLAEDEDADLIVMGKTGKGKTTRVVFGSTSLNVLSNSQCPVLLIPKKETYQGIHKIVFATDLTGDNLNAALNIVAFARHFKAEIDFVYVDEKHLLHSEEDINDMTKKIKRHVRYNKMSGYIAKSTSIRSGIDYFLKKGQADILVMFNHKNNFLKTLIHPSMIKKMSLHTRIPMLALPVEAHALV
jgi:nucleotide-binding universal stress UspA family protein